MLLLRAVPILLLTAACGRAPVEAVEGALGAFASGEKSELLEVLDPAYADPLGGKAAVLEDFDDMMKRYQRITIELDEVSVNQGASELEADVVGVIDAELVGEITWKVDGTVRFEVARHSDGFRVRSGLLTKLRDAASLMRRRRAALEANDPEEVRAILHPDYRDGDLDRDGAIARLSKDLSGKKVRMQATNYRLDLRGERAHVDEHFRLTVNDRPSPSSMVGRFTLVPSAGRLRIAAGLYPVDR